MPKPKTTDAVNVTTVTKIPAATVEVRTSVAQPTKTPTAPEKPTTQKARTGLKPTPPKSVTLKSVTPKLKREILHRDQFCQFKDAATGKVCGTKFTSPLQKP